MSSSRTVYASSRVDLPQTRHVTLLDLLDRLLAGGVVVRAQITLAVADVDLVDLDLALLVAATQTARSQ